MCPLVVFLVLVESSWQGGVYRVGFLVFQPMVGKLRIFELFLVLKNLRKYFYIYFGCGNGTRHTSHVKKTLDERKLSYIQ